MQKSSLNTILSPVSPGELLDKLTILEIKNSQINDSEKLKNIRLEYDILSDLRKEKIENDDKINHLYKSLKEVNESLWEIEDDIRECEKNNDFSKKFIDLARSVYVTNDKRAALKKEINTYLGSTIIEEKSYQEYK